MSNWFLCIVMIVRGLSACCDGRMLDDCMHDGLFGFLDLCVALVSRVRTSKILVFSRAWNLVA